ncbi:MAG: metal ABC transporter ATP-binding protein [Patescibacteria group bacterium]
MRKPSNKRSNNKNILEVKEVSVYYGDYCAVKNIGFAIKSGDILAIIGPNGSGKSTLLKAVLGLVEHTGSIKVFGKDIKEVLNDVGYVPQRFKFDDSFPLTVGEFLELSQLKKENIARRKEVLTEVEMQKFEQKLMGELSGGQMQRVLIAKALLNNPKILFLDEATAGVDVEGEKNFYEIINHLNKEHGLTIVLISHEINMVYKFATQVVCLNRDLICYGQTKEAITEEVMKKLYGDNLEFRTHKH